MSGPMEKDIREIKWRVEGSEKSIDLLVRANRKQIIEDLLEFFGRSEERVRVFLAIDGEKTVDAIAKSLNIRQPHVSRRITELKDEGLVGIKRTTREGIVYDRTDKVRILDLDKTLRKKFEL